MKRIILLTLLLSVVPAVWGQIPQITSVNRTPSAAYEGNNIQVTALVTGTSPTVKLFFGKNNQPSGDSLTMTFNGTDYSAAIPSAVVTFNGAWYRVRAQNASGVDYSPASANGSIAVRVSDSTITQIKFNSAFPQGIEVNGYSTVSLPLDTTMLFASLFGSQNILTNGNPDNWRAQSYNGTVFLDETDLQARRAYFLWDISYGGDLPISGSTNPPGLFDNFVLQPNSWNLVPWPYAFSTNISILDVNKIGSVWIENNGIWIPATQTKPYGAYAIYNKTSSSFTVGSVVQWTSVIPKPVQRNTAQWQIRFKVRSGGFSDDYNFAGIMENAQDGYDVSDDPKPMNVGPGISLSFNQNKNGKIVKLAADNRPVNVQGYVWDMEMQNNSGNVKVVLETEKVLVPDNLKAVLVDISNNKFIELNNFSDSYSFISTKDHKFKLIAGDANYVKQETDALHAELPASFELRQNYPNPFNPATTIRFDVAVASRVEISVYNILGQKVNMMANGDFDTGHYSIVWNGKDVSGNQAASGLYFYRISAKGINGKQYSKTMKMLLVK